MNKQIKILLDEPDLFFTLLIAPLFVLLLIIISPIKKIRVGHIHCDRIGHFAMNTELCFLERSIYQKIIILIILILCTFLGSQAVIIHLNNYGKEN